MFEHSSLHRDTIQFPDISNSIQTSSVSSFYFPYYFSYLVFVPVLLPYLLGMHIVSINTYLHLAFDYGDCL